MPTYPPVTTPDRYLVALGQRDPLESLRKAPKRVRKLVKGLGRKQLEAAVEDGKWSVKQVLAHLADGEVVLGARIRMVASMERPVLVGYDQDAFVRELRYDGVDAEQLLENFSTVRAINVALLERLPEGAFARVGMHTERGEESLATMMFMYAGHDRMHEAQIERLAALLAQRTGKRKKASPAQAAADAAASDAKPSKRSGKRRKSKKA